MKKDEQGLCATRKISLLGDARVLWFFFFTLRRPVDGFIIIFVCCCCNLQVRRFRNFLEITDVQWLPTKPWVIWAYLSDPTFHWDNFEAQISLEHYLFWNLVDWDQAETLLRQLFCFRFCVSQADSQKRSRIIFPHLFAIEKHKSSGKTENRIKCEVIN